MTVSNAENVPEIKITEPVIQAPEVEVQVQAEAPEIDEEVPLINKSEIIITEVKQSFMKSDWFACCGKSKTLETNILFVGAIYKLCVETSLALFFL